VTKTTTTTTPATSTTATTPATSTATRTVGQWSQVSSKEAKGKESTDMNGQCGGIGYTGSTVCTPPYVCVVTSIWWAHCQ
jgi:chitinase